VTLAAEGVLPAGDEKEIYAELVAGLGEAIVSGMVPGTSLSFTARKDDLGNPQVISNSSQATIQTHR
jgi:hypothetical protein